MFRHDGPRFRSVGPRAHGCPGRCQVPLSDLDPSSVSIGRRICAVRRDRVSRPLAPPEPENCCLLASVAGVALRSRSATQRRQTCRPGDGACRIMTAFGAFRCHRLKREIVCGAARVSGRSPRLRHSTLGGYIHEASPPTFGRLLRDRLGECWDSSAAEQPCGCVPGNGARERCAVVADQRHGVRRSPPPTASSTSAVTSPRCGRRATPPAPARWRATASPRSTRRPAR